MGQTFIEAVLWYWLGSWWWLWKHIYTILSGIRNVCYFQFWLVLPFYSTCSGIVIHYITSTKPDTRSTYPTKTIFLNWIFSYYYKLTTNLMAIPILICEIIMRPADRHGNVISTVGTDCKYTVAVKIITLLKVKSCLSQLYIIYHFLNFLKSYFG